MFPAILPGGEASLARLFSLISFPTCVQGKKRYETSQIVVESRERGR